jgi:hypothetical protein
MNRRIALVAAGTAALVLATGSAAVAANLGMLASDPEAPVGELDAQSVAGLTTAVEPVVVTVDEIVPVPVPDPSPADDVDDDSQGSGPEGFPGSGAPGSVDGAPTPTVTSPPTVRSETRDGDDDHDDDDHHDDDRHQEEEHEVEDD